MYSNTLRSPTLDDLAARSESNMDSDGHENAAEISLNRSRINGVLEDSKINVELLNDLNNRLKHNYAQNKHCESVGAINSSPVLSHNSFNSVRTKMQKSRSLDSITDLNSNRRLHNELDMLHTSSNNSEDNIGDEADEVILEEEDEDFANVDEIDGPITPIHNSPKIDENKSPLSEKFKEIDLQTSNNNNININNNNQNQKDYNISASESFQQILDQKASEFVDGSGFKSNLKPRIDWSLQDYYGFKKELPDWFTTVDYCYIKNSHCSYDTVTNTIQKQITGPVKLDQIITECLKNKTNNALEALTYLSLGKFGHCHNLEQQLINIRQNNLKMAKYLPQLTNWFIKIATKCRDDTHGLRHSNISFLYISTILFCITCTCIELRQEPKDENPDIQLQISDCINIFQDSKLLEFLTNYIDHWRWNSRLSMRIRNVIMLLFKLLILQFGDRKVYNDTKRKIYKYHGLHRSTNPPNKLSISPLQYEAFREDLKSRYPNSQLPKTNLDAPCDDSKSLSQYLEIPRPRSRSFMNNSLPIPEKHLATPVPSPPSSPVATPHYIGNGIKPRKSFQTNMAFPLLFPSDDADENTKNDKNIPYSIEEASKILAKNIEITLSTKQLWQERDLFIETERGWYDSEKLTSDDKTRTKNYPEIDNVDNLEEINIMKRIDNFYCDCLGSFNSLVFVLLQSIESNLSNVDYMLNDEANQNTNLASISGQLEVVRCKEILMRCCSGILSNLLKWFKLNHILKYEYLSSLINDSRYVAISSSVLGKYADIYSAKVFNEVIFLPNSFWKECSNSNLTYSQTFSMHKSKEPLNITMLSSFAYLLNILRKITGNKTYRLKTLPLSIGLLFKKFYCLFNLDIYHPMLKIIKELTPFKNKRWKSEYMDLISGVYLYEKLDLVDNWITGKDITGELNDATAQEIALRGLLQFYNFHHYGHAMEALGYTKNSDLNRDCYRNEADYASM